MKQVATGNSQQDAESVRYHDLVEMAIIQIGTNRKASRHHLRPKRASIEEQNKLKRPNERQVKRI